MNCNILYLIRALPFTIQISSLFQGIQKNHMGFVAKGREISYGFGEKKLARLHPNFIYVLTFETTLKCWEGKAHYYCTVLYCEQ